MKINMKACVLVLMFFSFCNVLKANGLKSPNLLEKSNVTNQQRFDDKKLFSQNNHTDCVCPYSFECYLNDRGELGCRCPEGKIEQGDSIYSEYSCIDCNCHASQECFLNDRGFPDCRCTEGRVENEVYGAKFCLDCSCFPTQECYVNEQGKADCRCSSGKMERDEDGVKTCIDCDCGDGICLLDENNIKKCHCGSKQVKSDDGKCYDCDCGVGVCILNENNAKICHCGSGQVRGENEKCFECDCGKYGICEFQADGKKCTCAPFTLELNGKCIECDCGSHGLCSFESGRKKCVCSPYSVETNGKCVVVIESSTSVSTISPSLLSTIISSTIPDCYCGSYSISCLLDKAGNKNCICLPGYSQIDGRCDALHSSSTEGTSTSFFLKSTTHPSTRRDCYCGENSKSCSFNLKGDKECICNPGYSEDNGYCHECDCGPRGKCTFEFSQKKCICDLYTSVKNGKCRDCNCGINSRMCYFRPDETKVCNCNFGYTQVDGYCSAVCNEDKCINGKCEIVGNGYKCKCNEGYTGLRCEAKMGAKPNTQKIWLLIPVFVLFFIIMALCFGMIYFKVCSKH